MVAPHKKNRKKQATQDGRRLRQYKRRFKVERFFSWLEDFRRLVVRWEYSAAQRWDRLKRSTGLLAKNSGVK